MSLCAVFAWGGFAGYKPEKPQSNGSRVCCMLCVCVCVRTHSWAEHQSVKSFSRLQPSNILLLNPRRWLKPRFCLNHLFFNSLFSSLLSISASLNSFPLISFSFLPSPFPSSLCLNYFIFFFNLFSFLCLFVLLTLLILFPFFFSASLFFSLIAFFSFPFLSLPLFKCLDWLQRAEPAVGPTQAHMYPVISVFDYFNSKMFVSS